MVTPAVAANSSKFAGVRRFRISHCLRAIFSAVISGAAFGAVATLVAGPGGTGWEFIVEPGAVASDVLWVACTDGVVPTDGVSLFLPHPAANIAALASRRRQMTRPLVVRHLAHPAEPENVSIR